VAIPLNCCLSLQREFGRSKVAETATSIMSSLNNHNVIVTGGSRGYGAGIAAAFVKAGARVWITGRDEARLSEAAQRIGAIPFVADVADGAAWDRLLVEVGHLDILINNAGEGVNIAPTSEQTDEAIARSIASNLTGAMLGCRRAAAIMEKQGSGLIVNIGSACSTHSWPGWVCIRRQRLGCSCSLAVCSLSCGLTACG